MHRYMYWIPEKLDHYSYKRLLISDKDVVYNEIWRANGPECKPGASAPDSGCEASKDEIPRKAVE